MKIRQTLTLACAATLLCTSMPNIMNAQSKGETKLYNTVLAKQDLKSARKFLAKYPGSVYAPQVERIKDSLIFNSLDANDVTAFVSFVQENPKSYFAGQANLKIEQLNTSSISNPQAFKIAIDAGIPEKDIAGVKGVKSNNKEHVIAIVAPKDGSGKYSLEILAQEGENWKKINSVTEQIYTNDSELSNFRRSPELHAATINGMQHLFFAYTNSSNTVSSTTRIPNNNIEYVANLYSLADNSIYNVMFSGKSKDSAIYGSSMDSAQGGIMATPQITYLLKHLKENGNLLPYNKELFHTQQIIEWWYETNHSKDSGNLQFGIIPANSELAQKFESHKDKERVGQYTVAMFDICHNTVVVVYNRNEKHYSLALCQPVPQTQNDLELGSYYGEKGNTLVLYYYKGKQSTKKRLNLGSKRMY